MALANPFPHGDFANLLDTLLPTSSWRSHSSPTSSTRRTADVSPATGCGTGRGSRQRRKDRPCPKTGKDLHPHHMPPVHSADQPSRPGQNRSIRDVRANSNFPCATAVSAVSAKTSLLAEQWHTKPSANRSEGRFIPAFLNHGSAGGAILA